MGSHLIQPFLTLLWSNSIYCSQLELFSNAIIRQISKASKSSFQQLNKCILRCDNRVRTFESISQHKVYIYWVNIKDSWLFHPIHHDHSVWKSHQKVTFYNIANLVILAKISKYSFSNSTTISCPYLQAAMNAVSQSFSCALNSIESEWSRSNWIFWSFSNIVDHHDDAASPKYSLNFLRRGSFGSFLVVWEKRRVGFSWLTLLLLNEGNQIGICIFASHCHCEAGGSWARVAHSSWTSHTLLVVQNH